MEFTKRERGMFTRANPDNIKNPVALVLSGADGKFLRKIEEADTADKAKRRKIKGAIWGV